MMRQEERVLAMVRAGTISQEEADRLLAALHVSRRERPSRLYFLIQPLDVLSPRAASIVATAVTLASLMVARLGVRYDGALDLHRVSGTPPWPIVLFDGANAVILTGAVLWLVARLFAAPARFVDCVMTVALARLAQVCAGLAAVVAIPNPETMVRAVVESLTNRTPLDISLLLGGVVLLPFFAWFLSLLYFGFRTSSGLSPARTGTALAVGLVAAEVLSKLALAAFASGVLVATMSAQTPASRSGTWSGAIEIHVARSSSSGALSWVALTGFAPRAPVPSLVTAVLSGFNLRLLSGKVGARRRCPLAALPGGAEDSRHG